MLTSTDAKQLLLQCFCVCKQQAIALGENSVHHPLCLFSSNAAFSLPGWPFTLITVCFGGGGGLKIDNAPLENSRVAETFSCFPSAVVVPPNVQEFNSRLRNPTGPIYTFRATSHSAGHSSGTGPINKGKNVTDFSFAMTKASHRERNWC